MRHLATTSAPDLSTATAQAFFGGFMPGCLASLIVALAFGTTKHLRGHLRRALVPRCCGLSAASSSSSSATTRKANSLTTASSTRSQRHLGHKHHRSDDFRRRRYISMDTDNGILSRRKRLSMEKQLRIQVTYEFEIRAEQVEVPSLKSSSAGGVGRGGGGGGGGGAGGGGARGAMGSVMPGSKSGGSRTYPYSVESHRWDDTERILPKKPSLSIMRGNLG